MKRLKRFINVIIWSLLSLYLLIQGLLLLPPVQHWMGSMVAKAVSSQLGTTASVGRVDLGFLNRLIVDDVVINDQQGAPLLSARRLAVKVDLLSLLDGRVRISSAQLFGAHVTLSRDSAQAVGNWQFAVDALSSGGNGESSALDLRIGSLIVSRLAVTYDQLDAPTLPGQLDMHHLRVSDLSAHILLKALTTDTLNVNVKRISLNEQSSGLRLQRLAMQLEANRQQASLTQFKLQLPETTLSIDTLLATYHADSIVSTLCYRAHHLAGTLSMADASRFLPHDTTHTALSPMARMAEALSDYRLSLSASFSGTPNATDCHHLHIADADRHLVLSASGHYSADEWTADIKELQTPPQLTAQVAQAFPTLPRQLQSLGPVSLEAQAHYTTAQGGTARCSASTALGNIEATASTEPWLHGQWHAHLSTDSLHLGQLADTPTLGLMAATMELNGTQRTVSLKGNVSRIDIRDYSYSDITLDGTWSQGRLAGHLLIDDPNINSDVEGTVDYTSPTPHVRLTGFVQRLMPRVLHLTDQWGDAVISAVVDADVNASNIADAIGTIDLDDFHMAYGDTANYHLDYLHLKTGFDNERHYLRLNSDFGEVQLTGHFDLNTLPSSLSTVFSPLVAASHHSTVSNDFSLSMRLTDSQWAQHLLGLPLMLRGPLSIDATLSDASQRADVTATIPAFSYDSHTFADTRLQLSAEGDSAHCHLQTRRITDRGEPQHLTVNADVKDRQIEATVQFSSAMAQQVTLNAITAFYTNDEGQRETHIRLLPSQLTLKNTVWELEPCDILYSDQRLMVDHFALHHNDEHLFIDGIASKTPHDSLTVDLQGVDVAYVLDLVSFRSVKFGGTATGKAYVTQAFSQPEAQADIAVDDFLFLDAPMGRLEARAQWNSNEGQADIEAAIDDGADAQTYIDGYISPRRNELDLGIMARGTSIGFLHSFTGSFLSDVSGQAWGEVRVAGPLKAIDLTGQCVVSGLTSVIPLGTSYTFQNDTVSLTPGQIHLQGLHVHDRYGQTALLTGTISHQKLKHFTYRLEAEARNLLAYDHPKPQAAELVGGTIWADGTVHINGMPGEVVIDCDVTPQPPSVFYYNAASPDAISRQQFITWTKQETPATGSSAPLPPKNPTDNSTPLTAQSQPAATAPRASASSDVRLNLRISATPESTLHLVMDQNGDDHIALNGNGTLRASFYNKGAFQLFGTYDVTGGTYAMTIQNLIRKDFQFLPQSTIIFGGDPMQAALNLKAQHTVSGVSLSDLALGSQFSSNTIRVNCLMNILGTAGEPRVEFDLDMPTVNSEEQQMIRSIMASEQELTQQVVYLLGIGRFYTQGANNAATQTYGQTELAMQSLLSGTVSSQINQLLSQVIRNDDWNFGANISTGNEGWHNAEYEGTVSGRMLNNRLLVNGQFGYRDNATQASPSFIGDFDISYLLTPGGSLALKAYNQTNDRYFTHSSLNTQGIGIILKKDFGNIGELFTIRKRK